MRKTKTKTKTKRKPSGATRKKRGGETSSRIRYKIRTDSTYRADIFNETNLSARDFHNITQRIDGTLDVTAIYDYVREHPELQFGLDTARPPRGTNHIMNREGTLHTIVASYPRARVDRSSSPPLRAHSHYASRPSRSSSSSSDSD